MRRHASRRRSMQRNEPAGSLTGSRDFHPLFICAWLLCLVFYFLQYALRSAPGVMMPELTAAFGLTTLGIGSLVGLYYYTYASFAIVAGATLDRYGAKLPIFVGVLTTALGSVLFGLGSIGAAE